MFSASILPWQSKGGTCYSESEGEGHAHRSLQSTLACRFEQALFRGCYIASPVLLGASSFRPFTLSPLFCPPIIPGARQLWVPALALAE